jgi:hypothetical protein
MMAILLCLGLSARAQQQLNIYTTTSGVVVFTFAQDPKVTFPTGETLAVTSDSLTVEFPFSEIEKITMEDGVTRVEQLDVKDGEGDVTIYDLQGRQVLRLAARSEGTRVDLSVLPAGTYVVKDGHRSYKVMKR